MPLDYRPIVYDYGRISDRVQGILSPILCELLSAICLNLIIDYLINE